jgi:hypothetical protein
VAFAVSCTACGNARTIEIPETQPVGGAKTVAELDE